MTGHPPKQSNQPAAIAVISIMLVAGLTMPLSVQGVGFNDMDTSQMLMGDVERSPCPAAAPIRSFDVVAIQIPISYNNWGDFDPHGRIFILAEEEQAVRDDVAAKLQAAGFGTAARAVASPTRASSEVGYQFPTGLSGAPNLDRFTVSDLVQPFVVRAHLGDCVVFTLLNKLPEPVSLHVKRAVTSASHGMAVGAEAPDVALPGQIREYVAYIPDEPAHEGAHFIQSGADARFQTKHGLFGALVAEPKDATWHAEDGGTGNSGQTAIIQRPGHSDFREYIIIYHDEIELLDHTLAPLPILSPYGEYGPGTKGMNLRSEPTYNRWRLHDEQGPQGSGELDRGHDKSQYLGSYTYGDPAVFIPKAYLGDPSKVRLMNAGPGQHHVHHLHGGGIRWRASPVAEDTQFDDGLVKVNPINQSASERQDIQVVGPGESYNLESEGGAGGVQQSAGDFLFHCHIAEHYIAGMWSFWRVFDTLQPGIAELPDRAGRIPGAVTSVDLVGREMPSGRVLQQDDIAPLMQSMLPPPGIPGPDDAAVWDWTIEDTAEGPLVLGEPSDEMVWPNFAAEAPGERPAIKFNPDNGRPAFPLLEPHFGKRPPFAPGHGPAPWLGADEDPDHPDGLCPADTRKIDYNIVAMPATVAYNDKGDVDPHGQVFSLAEDRALIEDGLKNPSQLIIRANQGDCVDILLTNHLEEHEGEHSKSNIHIHLVQFDVQASDGVITGLNYEQSVKPAYNTGSQLAAPGAPGDAVIQLADASTIHPGSEIGIGLGLPGTEIRTVADVSGNSITLDRPLERSHDEGELSGPEFVRYRWYADVELGMVYFHDHVDGLESWTHGLFGGLVVEPKDSQWLDPVTGEEIRSGTVANILGPNCKFREFVAEFQDRSAAMPGPDGAARDLASLNLRSEPFDRRTTGNPLSDENGEPSTDVWEAYPGEDVRVRLLYGGQSMSRAVGTFAVTGHRFPYEQWNPGSRTIDALSIGISAQHNLRMECGAGGCGGLPGDYLYYMTQPDSFARGAWGTMRVHDTLQPDLAPLPGHESFEVGAMPTDAPTRTFDITATSTDLVFNERFGIWDQRKVFVPSAKADGIHGGLERPEPLVMRAVPGEIVEVHLTNDLDEPVGLYAGMVWADARQGSGIPIGRNQDTLVEPGQTGTYRWYADRELGVVYLTSFANPGTDSLDGLYGALVIEPEGSSFDRDIGASAVLTLADGEIVQEHVLLYESDDPDFEGSVMPYTVGVAGIVGVNYRTEPIADRLGGRFGPFSSGGDEIGSDGVHTCQLNTDSCSQGLPGGKEVRQEVRNPLNGFALSETLFGAIETPVLTAQAGQRMVIRAVGGAGDQLQAHSVSGHSWRIDPEMPGSNIVDTVTLGPGEVSNAWMIAGEGGPGDYMFGSQRLAFREKGAWGILRVE